MEIFNAEYQVGLFGLFVLIDVKNTYELIGPYSESRFKQTKLVGEIL